MINVTVGLMFKIGGWSLLIGLVVGFWIGVAVGQA